MGMTFARGDRIELIRMEDDPDPIAPGTQGIVTSIQKFPGERGYPTHYEIDWDNGRALSIIVPPDEAKKI